MNTESNRDGANQQCSSWLDRDDEGPSAINESEFSADDQARIADLQVVDALLANLSSDANRERSQRIRRVMQAIETPESTEPAAKPQHHYGKLRSAMALAASVLVVLGFAWAQFSGESRASSVLREIGKVSLENIDRVYDLRRTSTSELEPKVEAKLYLRGRNGFVLQFDDAVLGRNSDEFWLVPKRGDVLIAENFRWMVAKSERSAGELELLKQLSVDSRRVPIMQLSAVVELMKDDYSVTLHSEERHGGTEHSIVGTLRATSGNLPDKISLWADASTSIIRHEFNWGQVNTLSLELTPVEQVPVDWYTHESHHDQQRGVHGISSEAL